MKKFLRKYFDVITVATIVVPSALFIYYSEALYFLIYFISVGSLLIKAESKLWNN